MPVFHTKTIQEILEPVAQQVSTMVIMDEEANKGALMPDLTVPVRAVSTAVITLVQVGRKTVDDSEDAQLKQELPRSLVAVETAADQLTEAAQTLVENPRSLPGRRLLLAGSRGILEGVSDMLLTHDECEVRKIVAVCNEAAGALHGDRAVSTMIELVEYIKALTPHLTQLSKHVDERQKDLTSRAHATKLVELAAELRKSVPMLMSSIKLFCSLQSSASPPHEAASSRDYVVRKMDDAIKEIIRILQLKTDRDELAQGDFNQMIGRILGKGETTEEFLSNDFERGQDFLSRLDPRDADSGFAALDECIAQARQLASQLEGDERDELERRADELEKLVKRLKNLLAQGKLDTPEARALANEISRKVYDLEQKMKEALAKRVAKDFLDPTGPAKQMTFAALADPSDPERENKFDMKARAFDQHARDAGRTAMMLARHGGIQDEDTILDMMNTIKQIQDLAPELHGASNLVLNNPDNEAAKEHMEMMKTDYCQKMDKLKGLVDQVADSVEFLKVSEKHIHEDLEEAKKALREDEGQKAVSHSQTASKRAQRVLDVAKAEAENSTDPHYVGQLTASSKELAQSIGPMVSSCKTAAKDTSNAQNRQQFDNAAERVDKAVSRIRQVVEDHNRPPRPPTPPPPPAEVTRRAEPKCEQIRLPDRMDGPAFPILAAARSLQDEATKWSAEGNALVGLARQMAQRMAEMGQLFDDTGDLESRKKLIELAKAIAADTKQLIKLAKAVANACTDRRLKQTLLQLIDRLPTISTQLRIVATVKATQAGQADEKADQESSETLVFNAQNLMQSVKEVLTASQAANIKLRKGTTADELMWTRAD